MLYISSWLAAGSLKNVVQCSSLEGSFRHTTKSVCIKYNLSNAQIMFVCIVAFLKRYRKNRRNTDILYMVFNWNIAPLSVGSELSFFTVITDFHLLLIFPPQIFHKGLQLMLLSWLKNGESLRRLDK